MKKFLEIIQTVKEGETPPVNLFLLRKEVKDEKEATEKLPNEEKKFIGKNYIARYHICHHEKNGKNKPCEIKILKEVNEQK